MIDSSSSSSSTTMLAENEQKEGPSSLSLADQIINRLSTFLKQKPTDFEIAILPTNNKNNGGGSNNDNEVNDNNNDHDDDRHHLSLDESIVLVDDKHLGIDARSLPWMTHTLRKAYKEQKQRTIIKLKNTNPNTSNNMDIINRQDWDRFYIITSCLLLMNPDHDTIWADRRRCILLTIQKYPQQQKINNCIITDWSNEITFMNLLMTQHSKAPFSWGHRKYVMKQIVDVVDNSDSVITTMQRLQTFIIEEIQTCTRIAEKYPKNYYAWTYRRYIWEILFTKYDIDTTIPRSILSRRNYMENDTVQIITDLIRDDYYALFQKWPYIHPSDHSCIHYLTQLLHLLLILLPLSESDREKIIKRSENIHVNIPIRKSEQARYTKNYVQSYIDFNGDHESAWILRRNVCKLFKTHADIHHQNKEDFDSDDFSGELRYLNCIEFKSVYERQTQQQQEQQQQQQQDSLHAWTFLAWCMEEIFQFRFREEDAYFDFQIVLAALENHPNVAHRMWKIKREELQNR